MYVCVYIYIYMCVCMCVCVCVCVCVTYEHVDKQLHAMLSTLTLSLRSCYALVTLSLRSRYLPPPRHLLYSLEETLSWIASLPLVVALFSSTLRARRSLYLVFVFLLLLPCP